MKKLLSLATSALVALAVAVSADAAPVQPQVVALQRRTVWLETRVHNLEARRAYLHRYIRHLRKTTDPIVTATETSAPAAPTTTSTSTTTATATGGWADELRAVGFPESAIPHMLYIIDRESGGCPTAVNGLSGCPSYSAAAALLAASTSHACGLIQAYPCYGGAAWLDPMTNLRIGYQKYQASGFQPWGG
jgi:hypothetical protein